MGDRKVIYRYHSGNVAIRFKIMYEEYGGENDNDPVQIAQGDLVLPPNKTLELAVYDV